jgi:hypothetical protein
MNSTENRTQEADPARAKRALVRGRDGPDSRVTIGGRKVPIASALLIWVEDMVLRLHGDMASVSAV